MFLVFFIGAADLDVPSVPSGNTALGTSVDSNPAHSPVDSTDASTAVSPTSVRKFRVHQKKDLKVKKREDNGSAQETVSGNKRKTDGGEPTGGEATSSSKKPNDTVLGSDFLGFEGFPEGAASAHAPSGPLPNPSEMTAFDGEMGRSSFPLPSSPVEIESLSNFFSQISRGAALPSPLPENSSGPALLMSLANVDRGGDADDSGLCFNRLPISGGAALSEPLPAPAASSFTFLLPGRLKGPRPAGPLTTTGS